MAVITNPLRNPIISPMNAQAGTNWATGDGVVIHDDQDAQNIRTTICVPVDQNPSQSQKYFIWGTEVYSATSEAYVKYNKLNYLYFDVQGRACFSK